ncbi:hypothetical protein BGZ76_009910 [Entomortierella beljakovae]|nr:hypothetical protein BGZ76_009910 [Entomortierella beljakovae]
MSYTSQLSSVSSYGPSQYHNQQNQQRTYSGDSPNQSSISSPNANYYGSSQLEMNRGEYYNTNGTLDHHQQAQQQQGYFQRQHYPNTSESPLSPNRRTFHEVIPSLSTKHSRDQLITPHDAPRITSRSTQRKREGPSQSVAPEENNLLSLDQYEEMLQQIASPGLGPTATREPRTATRRSEYDRDRDRDRDAKAGRQTRRKQDQQRLRTEPDSQPQGPAATSTNVDGLEENEIIAPTNNDRKSKRRSSLPSSFGDTVRRGVKPTVEQDDDHHYTDNNLLAPPEAKSLRKNIRRSWENNSVTPRDDLIHTRNEGQSHNVSASVKQFLLHADEEDGSRTNSYGESEKSDQDRVLPIGVRLSQTTNQSESDEIPKLIVPGGDNDLSQGPRDESNTKSVERNRQLRSGSTSPLLNQLSSPKLGASSPRLRSASPLYLVNEETEASSNRQQLGVLADDIASPLPSPSRPTHAGFSRSRPTTPVSSIRPPQMPMVSASINIGGQTMTPSPRKSSPAGRRMKPTPPISSSALPPTTPRPRTGSIASISSMGSFTMDTNLHQAPPSQPLPSLPPPTHPGAPTGGSSDISLQRRRKTSGGRDLVHPTSPLLTENFSSRQNQSSVPVSPSPQPLSPEIGVLSLGNMDSPPNSSNNNQAQITRLKKRVSTLEREIESLGSELSNSVKNGGELNIRVERLTIERDMLEKQVTVLQGFTFGTKKDDDDELRDALKKIEDDKDELLKEVSARQEQIKSEMLYSDTEILRLQVRGGSGRGGLERKRESEENNNDEIQRLRNQLSEQEQSAQKERKTREELELKLEALQILDENKLEAPGQMESSIQQELDMLRSQREEQTRVNSELLAELETLKVKLREEETQSQIFQDNIQQLKSQLEQQESQNQSEIQKLQQDHEEIMERVVIEHANALMEQSERSKSEAENGFVNEKQQAVARERVLDGRLREQYAKNESLEEVIFKQEKSQQLLEEDRESWMLARSSLERQLEMEQLQRQESSYKIEQSEKENKHLRAILSGLDLVTLLSSEKNEGQDVKSADLAPMYEVQRQRWLDQVALLERKMAKAEEAATEVMQKNMELIVTLDTIQSLQRPQQ